MMTRMARLQLSLIAALALSMGAVAQEQTQPATQVQPGQASWQAPVTQQHSWQIESTQRQLDTLFDRLLESADDDARQELEVLRSQMNRLIDNLLTDLDRDMGSPGMGQQAMGTDPNRLEQLEQRLQTLEQQARVERALSRAQRDLQGMRANILEGAERERSSQEFARIRADLERAFTGVSGTAQQRWQQLHGDFEAFEQRLRDEEDISQEDFDLFLLGFDFREEFDTGAWHDRPIAYQLGSENWQSEYRRLLADSEVRLEGLGTEFATADFDRERIAQELETIRSNLASFYERQFEGFQDAQATEREWWVMLQTQWLDLEGQLRADTPAEGLAEAHATLLENLRERGILASQQQRQHGLEQARSRLETVRSQAQAGEDPSAWAGELGQVRTQLRQQFRDAEGESLQRWNRLRTQLFEAERQLREGDTIGDEAWDEIFRSLDDSADHFQDGRDDSNNRDGTTDEDNDDNDDNEGEEND